MPPVKPMLDEIELKLVQKIDTEEEQVQAQHGVPALEGDFLQGLGRRATSVTLNGVMTGTEAAEDLKTLREKFRAAEPVSFVADIATATKVDQVLIEEMGVRELAGTPERFEYALTLREFVAPPPHETEEPPPIPPIPPRPIPSVEVGTLVVEVVVEGEPDFDFSTVRLTLQNNGAVGSSRLLTNRTEGVWVEENLAPGSYTASAVVESPVAMAGEEQATVRGGETTEIRITLRPGVVIAKAFVVHFRFDNAFIEPCLRQVLRRVFDYAQDHPDEKLVIVGHTDLVGGAPYNQKLSERRARSAYAFLTFGTSAAHREAAIDEWDNLRVNPPATPLNDAWDRREYQYMLQDLGYYRGRIDEPFADDPEPPRFSNADSAIRGFQSDHALPVTGTVDKDTWRALVTEYLSLDALAVPDSQFLPNANESGCNGGLLKWLGFGEKDPVKNTQDAWRPNRRTEMLFVRTDKLPNAVEQPETFHMPEPGVVGTSWCLNVGTPAPPPGFLARGESKPNKWLVVPAEPGKVTVSGVIKFADETRAANMKYVLIAPDGEFLREREDGTADPVAERPTGLKRGRGVPGRTDDEGKFSHPEQTPVGVYILQLPDLVNPSVARESNEPPTNAVGNVVCLRLTPGTGTTNSSSLVADAGPASFGATIHPTPPPVPLVNPLIQMTTNTVVVKKSYTNPARVSVTLRTSSRFSRKGVLTRSSDAIRFFTAPQGGTEILFNNVDNEFPGGRLSDPAGVQLFAQARTKSASANDFQLTLTLAPSATPGAQPVGAPLTVTMTALELTLNIHQSPTPGSATPPPLPQPPDPPPAPGTATDKWFGGRIVNVQSGATQERVLLSVAMEPTDFTGELTLRQVRVAGTTVGALDNAKLNLFDNANPTPGESPLANPFDFPAVGIVGRRFGVEGKQSSVVLRDRGFQLGVKGGEPDGDRVAITIGVGSVITLASPFALVKKAHTNPTRQAVVLSITAPFSGTGKFERSRADIRFFDALTSGNEITFNNTDNVFTGARLFGTVELFAEGAVPSPSANASDQVVLTLTLQPGVSPPAGTPATARMTSVELTLDIAVRKIPAANPILLAAADKANPGFFIQRASANFTHERSLMILRRPNPFIAIGTVVLRRINDLARAFSEEAPASGQTALPEQHTVASFLIPADGLRFFVEGRDVSVAQRDTGFRLDIQGVAEDCDRVAMTALQLDITTIAAPAALPAPFVRLGLWDNAFDPVTGQVRNGVTDATNFIGSDTRHFFLRLRDPFAANERPASWRTVHADGTADDVPASQQITLAETGGGTGLFFSKSLMLVADADDKRQVTNSGFAPPSPRASPLNAAGVPLSPGDGQTDHRLRRVTVDDTHQLDNSLVAEYSPTGARNVLTVSAPLFQRTPDERRRVRIHLVDVRQSVGGAETLLAARRDSVKSLLQSIYGVCGIFAEVNEITIDPPASCVGWSTRYPNDPPAATDPCVPGFTFVANNLVASTPQNDIINVMRNRADFDANDIYIICVARVFSQIPTPIPPPPPPGPGPPAGIRSGGGEAFVDSFTAAGSLARGFAFVGVLSGINDLADVHEATHITTDLRNAAGGHYDLGTPTALAPGNVDAKNLMQRLPLIGTLTVLNSKRLWDTQVTNNNYTPPLVIPRQLDAIRRSRFIRLF